MGSMLDVLTDTARLWLDRRSKPEDYVQRRSVQQHV